MITGANLFEQVILKKKNPSVKKNRKNKEGSLAPNTSINVNIVLINVKIIRSVFFNFIRSIWAFFLSGKDETRAYASREYQA